MSASFPQYNVTGTVHAWFNTNSTPGSGTWTYLGTCQVQPQVKIQEIRYEVKNDEHGRMLPAQKIVNGSVASIGLALNHFSWTHFATLRAQAAPKGSRAQTDRATLAMYGGQSFQLGLGFENYGNANFPDLPAGWTFFHVLLNDEDEMQTGNGVDQIKLLSLEAHPYRIISGGTYTWKTYDTTSVAYGTIPFANT